MCVFASYEPKSHEGYVFDITREQRVQLPTEIEWLPEWSPDSQKLLGISKKIDFHRRRIEGDIYAVNSDGTRLVKLTSQPKHYSVARWSPDGERIVFSAGEPDRLDQDVVYVMPASGLSAGARAIRLTNRPLHEVIDLQWSPDGSRIAILHTLERRENQWFRVGLLVVHSDGRGDVCSKPIVGSHASEGRFAWSPDGSRLAFACERHDGRRDLVSVCIMNANCTDVISSGLSSVAVMGFGTWPEFAWSPDGSKLVFTNNPDLEHGDRYEAPWEIWVMNRDGSGLTKLSAGNDRVPAWSPDGTKIAFLRRGEVYVMNADGSQQTRVTYGWDEVYEFAWAPR
jgi:Tol biopolymer transport system component